MAGTRCPFPDCVFETPRDAGDATTAAILSTHALIHRVEHAPVAVVAARVAAISRPSITSAGTAKEWKFFENQWRCYADATRIEGRSRVLQLLECCDLPFRRTLTQQGRSWTKRQKLPCLLAAIKHLAVRSESDLIAKVTFRAMRQAHDEPVRNFGARLRAQADLCDFEET